MREGLAAVMFATLLAAALPGMAHASEDAGTPQIPVPAETARPQPATGRPIALHVNRTPVKPHRQDKEQASADNLPANPAPQAYSGVIQ